MSEYDDTLITQAVNNVAPNLVDGGRKLRGPNATFDFIYQVWCEKAIIQTRQLPAMLEMERQNWLQQCKLLEEISHKGKYTDTYGWSPSREYKLAFSLSRPTYNYFANVVGPFLGYEKSIWSDNSRMFKYIKKLITDGDKLKISNFAKSIEKRLIKESGKKIGGAISGIQNQSSSPGQSTSQDDIQ